MKQTRTSRKQVENILEALTYEDTGYKLLVIDYCGKYKYAIARYSREPEYTDHFGKVITWTSWKFEERLVDDVTLKAAYEYASKMLSDSLKEEI
jgi:hypothetical protein